jgi:putative hemolysin
MLADAFLLLGLILLNGVLAMSEIAIVSSRRARLLQMADGGRAGAQHAHALAADPTRFLSTVQVGITSIGILNGAIGQGSITDAIEAGLLQVPALAAYAGSLATAIMVVALTYVSLILGELVPKRLALTQPEAVASFIARPMEALSTIGRPLVKILSLSTDGLVRLLGVRQVKESGVTADEIRVMLRQGAEEGVFEPGEQLMVSNVLNLDERPVAAVLTPRSEVIYLDVRDPIDVTRARLKQAPHSVFPLCDGGLEHVLGFIRSTRVLEQLLDGAALDLPALAQPPLFVPEAVSLMTLLEEFKRTRLTMALVVDEHGDVAGLISFTDLISSIVGDLSSVPGGEPPILQREDGSWLMDGGVDLDTVVRVLDPATALLTTEDRQHYHTLGGLAMLALGRIPKTGDVFERGEYRFEIVDMDGNRVDRVMVNRRARAADPQPPESAR